MRNDLQRMINFKGKLDPYDSERWYKKRDLRESLSFTTYVEFKGFNERWKRLRLLRRVERVFNRMREIFVK